MLPESIDQFKFLAPLQLPELIDPAQLETEEYTDDYAILTYNLVPALTVKEVFDIMDEQMELILGYHKVPFEGTYYQQSCCAFSNPEFGHMYIINALADPGGKCSSIYATIFSSLEVMKEYLSDELRRVGGSDGRFLYRIKDTDMLIKFM